MLRQYVVESDNEEVPFSHVQRSIVYQRAKNALDVRPFGTELDVYAERYEWINHSMAPTKIESHDFRIDDRRRRVHAAVFGERVQHLGDELRRDLGERDPRAQRRRAARRLLSRHRRGLALALSPRERRRHRLGDRLRLFRRVRARRHLQRGALRRQGDISRKSR